MKISNKRLHLSKRKNCITSIQFYFKNVSESNFLPKLSRIINKYLYYLGLGSSINRYDNSLTLYSAKEDKFLYSEFNKNDKFINFGSGAFYHKRWKNYDYPGQTKYYKSLQGINGKDFFGIDLCNLNLSIPEDDNSVSLIYCAHTLEHLDISSSIRFLKECYRILKKDGVLRVAMPNVKNDFYLFELLNKQFSNNSDIKLNYFSDAASKTISDSKILSKDELKKISQIINGNVSSFFEIIKKKYEKFTKFNEDSPERHINYWDFEKLINTTSKIGFSMCIPTYQGSSVALPFSNISVFDNTEPQISFYADIVK